MNDTNIVEPKNNIDIFYFLRAIAILCIFGMHSVISTGYRYIYSWFFYTPAWGGVWTLFVLSGYLIGKGFYKNKYGKDIQGILNFYLNRIIRIIPLYLFFIFIVFLFISPQSFIQYNYKIIVPLLTLTYNADPDCAVGATWFISTIMQLYFLAPLAYKFIFEKIKKHNFIIILSIVLAGLGWRLIANFFKLDHLKIVYMPFYSNLDLFFAGFALNSITQKSFDSNIKKYLRPISIIAFFALIITNTYCVSIWKMWIYRYIFPSLYLVINLLIIYSFDSVDKVKNKPLDFKNILKNPLRLIEAFGIISFPFYLFHSDVLGTFTKFFDYYHGNSYLVRIMLTVFTLTTILSIIIYYAIEKPLNNFRVNLNKGRKT